MTTRAELAFKALDKDNSGYITNKEMKNLSSKLSATELDALMKKVRVHFLNHVQNRSFVSLFLNFSSTPTVTENWHLMNSKKCLTKLIWKLNKEKQRRKSPSGIPQRDWRQEKFYTIEQSVWILGIGVCGFVHNIVHCTSIHYESFTISSHNKVYNVFTSSCLPFNHSYNSIPSFLVVHKV